MRLKLFLVALAALILGAAGTVLVQTTKRPDTTVAVKEHRVVIQVDRSDPDAMKLALNNAVNMKNYYNALGQKSEIELVAFGPGLDMLRADLSPVQQQITELSKTPGIRFSACGNTLAKMNKAEGKKISLLPEAQVVPTGVARIVQLQEAGWTYLRP